MSFCGSITVSLDTGAFSRIPLILKASLPHSRAHKDGFQVVRNGAKSPPAAKTASRPV